ncbi:prepilin peptidase [Pelagibius sp.]|uniref:A24 family peptidase n=1 Tax=Pelagibius sp. TaxID=1931238 RepID=UPI002603916B|nr:prepilin peptidase [Pelagibius sp.]
MDLSLATSQFTVLAFAGLLIMAAASDCRNLTVPNRFSLALVALYPSFVIAAGGTVDWLGGLICASAAFAIGFVLFALRLCGGADVKLFAAVTLWAGPALIVPMLIYTTMAGGLLALAMWFRHRLLRAATPTAVFFVKADPDFIKQPMPYGVAIAAGGFYVAFQLLAQLFARI